MQLNAVGLQNKHEPVERGVHARLVRLIKELVFDHAILEQGPLIMRGRLGESTRRGRLAFLGRLGAFTEVVHFLTALGPRIAAVGLPHSQRVAGQQIDLLGYDRLARDLEIAQRAGVHM